jgi:MFS family permease
MATKSLADETATRLYPSARSAWWTTIVLTLGCVLAFMDRNIISLFVVPIQRDLGLSDTQMSLLIGFAFAFCNGVFGLPIARWVDSGSRKTIAAIGVAVWSVATIGCGLARNFGQLFIGRMLVGTGEAAVTPCGVSIIADLFPPGRRGAAMGVFYGGIFVGGGGAFIIGGALWRVLGDRQYQVPVLGALHSWQLILMLVGALGLIVAPLTLALREPARLEGGRQAAAGGVPLAKVVSYYRTHARALGGHNLGFCLQNFALHAGAAWLPTVLVRTQGWSIAQAGATFGAMMLILGPLGSATAGLLGDALARRGRTDSKFLVSMGAAVLCAMAAAVVAMSPSAAVMIIALAVFAFFGTFSLPLAPGALQEIMPNDMRGQATAVYVGVTNLVAGGLAATAVALITDYVFHDKAKIHIAFGMVGFTVSALAVVVLGLTLKAFRTSVAQLAAEAAATKDERAA